MLMLSIDERSKWATRDSLIYPSTLKPAIASSVITRNLSILKGLPFLEANTSNQQKDRCSEKLS